MNRPKAIFQCNSFKKTSRHTQYPNDFHFHYQKSDNEQVDHMSPTSTCPSEGKSTYWEYQSQEKLNETQLQSSYPSNHDLGNLQGNLLASCIQKYNDAVSDHIKQCLNLRGQKVCEFILVKEFQGLDMQKQQFSNILSKYYGKFKSRESGKSEFLAQNSMLRTFMQQITYLNYEQINMQLMEMIREIYQFKMSGRWQSGQIREFFDRLSRDQGYRYISFSFVEQRIDSKVRKNSFGGFIQKLFEIITEMYIHDRVFQTQQQQYQAGLNSSTIINRSELKLFSSQRDIWDSQDEDEVVVRLSYPNKKIKIDNNNKKD